MIGRIFRKMMPQTLFGRSLLIIITPVLLLQIVVTVVFFDRHWSTMTSRLSYAVAGEISLLADEIENTGVLEEDVSGDLVSKLGLLASFEKNALISHEHVNTHLPQQVESALSDALKQKLRQDFVVKPHDKEKWISVDVQLKNGVLEVLLPQNRLFSSTTYIFFLWMAGSSLVLIGVSILFMRNQIRPIRRLAEAAERFGRGMDFTLRPRGASEIRQATTAFLEMHDRISRQIEQRTAMLAGVSHDLRTPLTRMKLQLELLENNSDVAALKGDIVEMERMIDGYLAFARGLGEEATQRLDLAEILERVVAGVRREGIEVFLTFEGDLSMKLRPGAMERCVANLVNNAKKYGKTVWVHGFRHGDVIDVMVDDDGPGIPADMLEEAFRPFFRIDKSRNTATGGVGLGLSIARDIAHAHGGNIWLEKSNRGGLRAVVRLPV